MDHADERVRIVRIVVASPGDVARECVVAQTVVDELNRGVAADRGCRLSLWRWEVDARPGVHLAGPQGLIDELMNVQEADVVVGVFWKRFGTPTKEADSGTEHELRRAWAAWQKHGRPELMVYFRTRAYAPRTPDELAQWQRVLEFRNALPQEQLSWPYANAPHFERLLREHLTRYLQSRMPVAQPVSRRTGARRLRFNLPAVAASFTGRGDELGALDEALGIRDRAVITQAITGLGGVGKSQLAARYVQQHAEDYDVVAWIRAEDGGIADLAALAAKLGEPVEGLAPGEQAQLALDWLGDSAERWLLVLDNVASAEQLDRLRPSGGGGRVLVTSRDRALRQFGPVLAVDVFTEDTATGYLTDRAGRPGDDRAARELARAVGCLPLALSHAAAYCQSGTSFADYLELLGELPARELFDTHPELSYAQTVTSTWRTSIHAAAADAALAADVLEMAAHLGADAIPKSLFAELVDAGTALGRKRLADALNALARFSLASVDDESVSVHRLLQKTVRDDCAARDDQTAALRALSAMCSALPADVSLPADWPACEQLLPHVLALSEAMAQPGDAGPQVTTLLNGLCQYLNWAEPGGRGLAMARATLRYAEHVLSAEHRQRLTARGGVAAALRHGGHARHAIAAFEELVADCVRILGGDDPDTLTARHLLAYSLHDAGRTEEAIAIYEPVLVDRERVRGAEHPDTLMTRNNLALAYRRAGRTGEAITIFERVLADRGRILGIHHPSTLTTRHNLACCYRDSGRSADAIAMFEPLVADRERILGTEHPQTLISRRDLALAYRAAGRTADADAILATLDQS